MLECFGNLVFHGFGRDAEAGSNFLGRQLLVSAQLEYLPASLRQASYPRRVDLLQLVEIDGMLGTVCSGNPGDSAQVQPGNLSVTKVFEYLVPGHAVQVRRQAGDGRRISLSPEIDKYLLGQVAACFGITQYPIGFAVYFLPVSTVNLIKSRVTALCYQSPEFGIAVFRIIFQGIVG